MNFHSKGVLALRRYRGALCSWIESLLGDGVSISFYGSPDPYKIVLYDRASGAKEESPHGEVSLNYYQHNQFVLFYQWDTSDPIEAVISFGELEKLCPMKLIRENISHVITGSGEVYRSFFVITRNPEYPVDSQEFPLPPSYNTPPRRIERTVLGEFPDRQSGIDFLRNIPMDDFLRREYGDKETFLRVFDDFFRRNPESSRFGLMTILDPIDWVAKFNGQQILSDKRWDESVMLFVSGDDMSPYIFFEDELHKDLPMNFLRRFAVRAYTSASVSSFNEGWLKSIVGSPYLGSTEFTFGHLPKDKVVVDVDEQSRITRIRVWSGLNWSARGGYGSPKCDTNNP